MKPKMIVGKWYSTIAITITLARHYDQDHLDF